MPTINRWEHSNYFGGIFGGEPNEFLLICASLQFLNTDIIGFVTSIDSCILFPLYVPSKPNERE